MMKKIIFLLLIISSQVFSQNFWWWSDEPQNRTVYAVNLNGTNEWAYKNTPSGIDLEPDSSITIMAWIKTADRTNYGYDVSARTNSYDFWLLQRNEDGSGKPFALVNDGGSFQLPAVSAIANDTWYFQALTMDADSIKLYINGVRVASTTAIINPFNDSPTIDIGAWTELGIRVSNSTIGGVQIVMGYALTSSEINQNYVRGIGGLNYLSSYPSGRIVAWYKWDGTSDAEFLNDASSFNNDLTGNNITRADDQVTVSGGYK